MKTPWSKLLNYGTTAAAILVLAVAGIAMMTVVALAVVLSKILLFIK